MHYAAPPRPLPYADQSAGRPALQHSLPVHSCRSGQDAAGSPSAAGRQAQGAAAAVRRSAAALAAAGTAVAGGAARAAGAACRADGEEVPADALEQAQCLGSASSHETQLQ